MATKRMVGNRVVDLVGENPARRKRMSLSFLEMNHWVRVRCSLCREEIENKVWWDKDENIIEVEVEFHSCDTDP